MKSRLPSVLRAGCTVFTKVPGYTFYQGKDSSGNDLASYKTLADNVPELVKKCDAAGRSCMVSWGVPDILLRLHPCYAT